MSKKKKGTRLYAVLGIVTGTLSIFSYVVIAYINSHYDITSSLGLFGIIFIGAAVLSIAAVILNITAAMLCEHRKGIFVTLAVLCGVVAAWEIFAVAII